MIIRNEWLDISNDSLYASKDQTVSNVKENFDIRRFNSAEGESVLIDDIREQVMIQSHSNPLNEHKEDKKILCSMDSLIKKGSYVDYDNSKWIVISQVSSVGNAYKTAQIYKTSNTLTFYKNHISYTIPCIIGKLNMDIKDTKYGSFLDGEVYITVPNNSTTSLLNIDDVFKLGRWSYKIIGIDDISSAGMLILKYQNVTENPIIETPIPSPIINGVEIFGENSIMIGYTKDYSCEFKVNGQNASEQGVFYLTSSDGVSETNLATITRQDSTLNTCSISGKSYGVVKLWVKNINGNIASKPFTIQINNLF